MNKYLMMIFCAVFFNLPVFAGDTGQIINVNQSYQIAFTDLGNSTLKRGDIVKVSLNSDEFVYMQVLESSAILSKLGVSQQEGFKTNFKDLLRISVGNAVAKVVAAPVTVLPAVSEPQSIVEPPPIAAPVEPAPNAADVQRLEQKLNEARTQLQRLAESNEVLKSKINDMSSQAQPKAEEQDLKAVIAQLKVRLQNMQRIINEI